MIGANDIDAEGSWVWTDGSVWNYTNWFPGEPNNFNGVEHCVIGLIGGWTDFQCAVRFPFICKKLSESPVGNFLACFS